MSEVSKVLPADTSEVPALRIPQFKRDSFLQPPDWRYEEAYRYICEEKAGRQATASSDPAVQYLVRVLRAIENPYCREYLDNEWKATAEVVHIGTMAKDSAFARELEIHIINGDSWEAINAGATQPWFTKQHYELFKLFFFDLSDMRAVTAWMSYHLFEPASASRQSSLLRTRLLAYYNGESIALDNCHMGLSTSDGAEAIKRFATTERQKRLVDYILETTKLPLELYATIMESARKEADDRDMKERIQATEAAGDATLQDLAKNLAEGIRSFTTEELEEKDKFGLEFTNRFTHKILEDK